MVTVYEIVPGSPADKVGIKAGDALHTVNGHEIKDVLDYRFFIFENRLDLELSRDGVYSATKNYLTVQGDTRISHPLQISKNLSRTVITHHLNAQFGISGVNRNVDGRHMHSDYTLNVFILKISKSYIITHKEGKSGIVILKIESLAHSLGQLVDKTENTPIMTGALLIHQVSFKLKSNIGVPVLVYLYLKKNTVSG